MSKSFQKVLWSAVRRMQKQGMTRGAILQRLSEMEAETEKAGKNPADFWVVQNAIRGELVEMNNVGIELEKRGGIDLAVEVYENCIREGFHGTHAYERLRIYYTKNRRFDDAIRVSQAEIRILERSKSPNKDREIYKLAGYIKNLSDKRDGKKTQRKSSAKSTPPKDNPRSATPSMLLRLLRALNFISKKPNR